jgi:hypothetical protein
MASLAICIILMASPNAAMQSLDEASKVMQRNVAAVAFVYCATQIPGIIQCAEMAFQSEKMITFIDTNMPYEVTQFFFALNSVLNIFVYMLVGKKFPRIFFTMLTDCRQKERRGGQRVHTRAVPSSEVTETKL